MSAPAAIPVILNPEARSGLAGALPARIKRLSPRIEICATERRGHARELAYGLVMAGYRIVVAAGGDGTVNEVATGLARANIEMGRDPADDAALGVLPTGTMNVFALELGIGPFDLGRCWRAVEMGGVREVDLWCANDNLFVQMAGVGFDAEVVRDTTWEAKRNLGPLSYLMSAASVMRRVAVEMKVDVSGRGEIGGAVVLVGNGRRYGGPVGVFRDAVNDDGLLDVIVLRGRGMGDILRLARGTTLGGFGGIDGVEYFQAAEFSVGAAEALPVQVDGELVGETPVRFSHAGRMLRVLAS